MKKVTIKDIASATNISQGTIHRALNGKKGVSDEVRDKIISVAKEMGYKPNYIASALKRKHINVLVYLPLLNDENTYFYNQVLRGIEKAFFDYSDYNVSYKTLYFDEAEHNVIEKLSKYIDRSKEEISGIITISFENLENIVTKIPTVIINSQIDIGQIASVSSNYKVIGGTLAELLRYQIAQNSDILLVCDKDNQTYKSVVDNFSNNVIPIFDTENQKEKMDKIKKEILENDNLGAVFSIGLYNTVFLGRILRSIEYNKNIKIIGSEVFDESVMLMEKQFVNFLIHANIAKQSHNATKILLEFIIKNQKPDKIINYGNVDIVFNSNLRNNYTL